VNPPLDVGYLFSQKESEPHWRVVYLYGNGCDAQCEDIMNVMRQMQKALGKNATRVQLVFLGGPVSSAQVKKLQDNFPNKNFIASQKIYLVDPLNNLFMYYPSTTNMMNVLKDLKKVLEVSQIG
jgi:cytochrome oxidase Cu insertion factor (SCO1/SenC/PrrC family)